MSNKIDQAFTQAFITAAFGLAIVHENMNYKPDEGTAYAELRLIPNDITPLTLADTNETDGLFRVWLRYPQGTGAVAAKTMADTIFATFPIGGKVTYGGQSATITRHNRMAGTLTDENWYELTLSIGYWAAITR